MGVESQSSAATEILSSNANIAGLGGFSGRESSVTASWIAQEVSSGHLRWIMASSFGGGGAPGDTRTGSATVLTIVEKVGTPVTFEANGTKVTIYDLQGKAAAILAAAQASTTAAR
jgi:hypothetical protein